MTKRDITVVPIQHGGRAALPPLPEGQDRRPTRAANPPAANVGENRITVREGGQVEYRARTAGGMWSVWKALPGAELELRIVDAPKE